jgi:plastocyanin
VFAEAGPDIFQQLLNLLQSLVMPVWSDLIALIPFVLIAVVAAYLLFTAWQWRRAAPRNRPRLIARYAGSPPPGVHVAAPSRWPFVVPIGLAGLLFAVVLPAERANVPLLFIGLLTSLIWLVGQWRWLFLIGGIASVVAALLLPATEAWTWLITLSLIVALIAAFGWGRDAMSEWRHTALVAETGAGALAAVAQPALAAGPATAALVPAAASAPAAAAPAEEAPREPPPGVHMPGPSPWPFFAPIGLAVMFYGIIFNPILIVGGIILGLISAGGWLLDASREWRSTEAVGHAEPRTRDPREAWPRLLVPLFAVVIVVTVVIAFVPGIGGWLNSLQPAPASPTPVAVPAVPEISASNAISFETNTLIVPAGRDFQLIFHNKQAGVPHNVMITDGPSDSTIYFDGEVVTGPTDVTYQVPALPAGTYYFQCKIHPNMNGTVEVLPESGTGGSPPAGASASP